MLLSQSASLLEEILVDRIIVERDGTGGIQGYPIFSIMQSLSPDFFIFNGDQIYGDNTCSANGPSNVTGWTNIEGNFPSVTDNKVNWNNQTQVQDIYNKHWEYNRADPHLQSLLRNTSMYSQADDHEVVNDYGGKWSYWTNATENRTGFPNVVKAGINAFFNFSPIDRNKASQIVSIGLFIGAKTLICFY